MKYAAMMQTINLTFASHYEISKERCYISEYTRIYANLQSHTRVNRSGICIWAKFNNMECISEIACIVSAFCSIVKNVFEVHITMETRVPENSLNSSWILDEFWICRCAWKHDAQRKLKLTCTRRNNATSVGQNRLYTMRPLKLNYA